MRLLHKFLCWFPAWVAGTLGAGAGLIFAAASVWTSPKAFAEAVAKRVLTTVSAPIFWWIAGSVAAAWLFLTWWSSPLRRPTGAASPQLYLFNWPPGEAHGVKGYLASWSPTDFFHFRFCDHAGTNSLTWPLPPTAERRFTFHLLNAGPGPVRHIRATWALQADIPKLIKSSGIFEGFIRRLSRNRLSLISESAGFDRPIATKQTVDLPILADGQSVPLVSPEAFTNGIIVYALAEALRLKAKIAPPLVALQGMAATLDYMDSMSEPMRFIYITLTYETEDRTRIRQRFRVSGHMHGNVATMKLGTEENTYSPATDGTSAWLDHVNVEAI